MNKNEMIAALNAKADEAIAKYQRQARIVAAIRKGLAKVRHHRKYTSRVVFAIKVAILAEFPESENSLVVSGVGYGDGSLKVWGVAGLTFESSLRFSWNMHRLYGSEEARAKTWADLLEADIARYDFDKWIAVQKAWKAHAPALVETELRIQALKAEVKALSEGVSTYGLPSFAKEIIPNVYAN